MKQILLALEIFALGVLVFVVWQFVKPSLPNGNQTELKIGEAVFKVEIADNPALWQKGLSGRRTIGVDEGMLFVFPKSEVRNFWMKDMRFPIDIVWIANNQVVGFTLGVELEKREPFTIYTSPQPVNKVLEVSSGVIWPSGIQIGDMIKL